jgi:DNA-binding HxlR family transcriptional regulator
VVAACLLQHGLEVGDGGLVVLLGARGGEDAAGEQGAVSAAGCPVPAVVGRQQGAGGGLVARAPQGTGQVDPGGGGVAPGRLQGGTHPDGPADAVAEDHPGPAEPVGQPARPMVQGMNLTGRSERLRLAGMRGYGQFCPVALGAEVFAERWTPLILRELLAGSHRFSELQRGLPGIPRALLTQRLGALQRAGLLMWFLRRRIHVERLPAERVTVQFEFRGADKRRFWLVLHGSVTLAGPSDLRRAFGGWIGLSPFASAQPSKFTS